MAELTLKRLFTRSDGPGRVLNDFLATLDEPFRILDLKDQTLFQSTDGAVEKDACFPILYQEQPLGWLYCRSGSRLPAMLGGLIDVLYSQESVKKALAAEVLDRYRELNLLYRLSERMMSTDPQPRAIAALALEEACPMIRVTAGMVIFLQPDEREFEVMARCGSRLGLKTDPLRGDGIVGRVLRTGNGELSNLVNGGDYCEDLQGRQISVLCSPIKTERTIRGAFIMINDQPGAYNAGDLKLLNAIATHASPVIEMAQLHQFELERARIERDLYNARKVQADLLPREKPQLPGWDVSAFWQPAREVGGDFYDFIPLPGERVGLVVADVADKGMPAALVMANTRSILRAVAIAPGRQKEVSAAKILERANALLARDMPTGMFVTCLLAILDPADGKLIYANAGHNLPYLRRAAGVIELRATGFPLGIFPHVNYEDQEAAIAPGESLLIYSDGLPEAHDPHGEMYDYPRMRDVLGNISSPGAVASEALIQTPMDSLRDFTGPEWEQEDDVTLLAVTRN